MLDLNEVRMFVQVVRARRHPKTLPDLGHHDCLTVLPSGRLIPAAVSVFVDFVDRALGSMEPPPPVPPATVPRRRVSRP
jgi:hypothetical protein